MTRLWPQGILVTVFTTHPGLPQVVVWGNDTHQVIEISRQWQVDWSDEEGRVWRAYFKLRTDTGLLIIIYHDWLTGQWYLQRLYD